MTEGGAAPLTLSVAEALPKDVGRGIARLDPRDMASLGVQVGDILQVVGKRATAAKAMPAYVEARGKGLIQIDGITRENARMGLGEQVQVQRAAFAEATSVVIAPVTPSKAFVSGKDAHYLTRVLEGLPLTQGDRVRATLLGSRYQEFSVMEASPVGVVVVGPRTIIRIKREGGPARE